MGMDCVSKPYKADIFMHIAMVFAFILAEIDGKVKFAPF